MPRLMPPPKGFRVHVFGRIFCRVPTLVVDDLCQIRSGVPVYVPVRLHDLGLVTQLQ